MTIGIRFAARSDVGMLREGNEDSAYAGPRLLVVADGMGGHVGGEIASAAAVETLQPLDADIPAGELVGALEQAVHRANETLHAIVEGDPALQGMGTTLTAMLWHGHQMALVHIGDSRAYLLRNGELFQITHDHTLVQSLVDEGRISLDEAASHPQRSLLLRALDGRGEVEPDVALREAQIGDRYLLCSDGLSTVVSAETIHHALSAVAEPEQAVRQLIDLANRGGGPDNITCVVADVVELESQPPQNVRPIVAGAAQNASRKRGEADTTVQSVPPPGAMAGETPAQRAAQLRDPAPVTVADLPAQQPAPQLHEDTLPQMVPVRARRGRRWVWLIAVVGVFLLLIGGGGYFAWTTIQGQYYIAPSGNRVAIYQGVNSEILGTKLYHLKEPATPQLLLDDLNATARRDVDKTIDNLGSLTTARQTVERLRKSVCKGTVAQDREGMVVIWKGRGQDGCPNKVVKTPEPPLRAGQLTIGNREKIQRGITVRDVAAAEDLVFQLRDEAATCKERPQSNPDCPQPKNR